jgi:excisionase family DNA binding protein
MARKPNGDRDVPDQFLTVKQLAALWQMHERTIHRMIKAGEIEIMNTDRRLIRIHPDVARRGPKKRKPNR